MEEAATEIFIPVLEAAIVLASNYATKCGRSTVTSQDLQYGFRFAARNVLGNQIGSLYPEIYDEEEEEEEDEEDDEEFTRYIGDDEMCLKMNACFDTWEEWVPETPVEKAIKKSVDRAGDVQA
jgi:histone H3/H4